MHTCSGALRPVGVVSATAAALAGLAASYAAAVRPRLLSWGATPQKAQAPMPGNGVVPMARYRTPHAVTIDAPVDEVSSLPVPRYPAPPASAVSP